MCNLRGKKLLVLGGGSASFDIVKEAQKLGIYVIVADNQKTGVAKEVADESYLISTTDFISLNKLVEEKRIDGVFSGPSEFNIVNAMKLASISNLPFYCNKKQWDVCSNKAKFKKLCDEYGVPSVTTYYSGSDFNDIEKDDLKFPIIVKPVDGSSSRGISVCYNFSELEEAFVIAKNNSIKKDVIIEKYIESKGDGFSAWYIVVNGEVYLNLTGDKYVVDPIERKSLVSALSVYPSRYTEYYIDSIDNNVKKMIKSIGLKDGVFFLQGLVDDGNIYFHEMGLRLSGGLIYKITEPVINVNDVKMMLKYSVGEEMNGFRGMSIDPYLDNKIAASLTIPLKEGVIGFIGGVKEVKSMECVSDFIQYYDEEDIIKKENIGTLMQHFGRVKFILEDKSKLESTIKKIQSLITVKDKNNQEMIYKNFDIKRLY